MDKIQRLYLAHLPTPIEPLTRLTGELGGPQLFIKRDDQTGLALGGNKTRKLEFLLADALAHEARTLITAGAVQSNHCRQTAAAAARAGLACTLVLSGDPPGQVTANLLLDQLFGARLVWTTRELRERTLRETFESDQRAGNAPYLIPYGGSNAIGAQGYVYAVDELMKQVGQSAVLDAPPDWIVFPSSSGGTQAGLVLGARLFGFPGKVLGISVDEPQQVLQQRIATIASQAAALHRVDLTFEEVEILVNANYLGGGYAVLGAPEQEAISLFARFEGVLIDPVYTGRAAAGMIDLIRQGYFNPGERVLFWHTGGAPALFAQQYQVSLSTPYFNSTTS